MGGGESNEGVKRRMKEMKDKSGEKSFRFEDCRGFIVDAGISVCIPDYIPLPLVSSHKSFRIPLNSGEVFS